MPAPKSYTSCVVPGCNVNLKNDGKASSKLGTCLKHRSELTIHVDGESFRHCQQCVKLHPLSEFDGKKRGCRQRLADHNMRRQRNNLAKRMACELKAPPSGPSGSFAEVGNISSGSHPGKSLSSASLADAPSPNAERAESEDWSASVSGAYPCETLATYDSQLDSCASALKESAALLPPEDLHLLDALDWACGINPEENKQRRPRLSSPQMQSETISVNFGASPARAQAPLFSADTYNSTDPFDLPCMDLPPMGTSGVYSSLIQDSSISAAWGTGSSGYHMSMKINNATPANLPHGLAQNLLGLHSVGPLDMQGAIRPGCVHLGIDFTMPSVDQRDSTAEAFMRNLLTAVSANNDMPWCNFDTDIFLPDSIIKIRDAGANISINRNPMRPLIKAVSRIAATTGEVVLEVANVKPTAIKALCRIHGQYHELELVAQERHRDGTVSLTVLLPEDDSGLALLEVYQETAAGMVVSFPEAMLVTNDEEVAEELSNGLRNRPAEQVESVLRDFAAAMHSKDEPSLACFRSAALTATALGLPLTLQEIVESASLHAISPAQVVRAANWEPEPGALLRQAVLSGSLETVITVLLMLQDSGIEAGLCKPHRATGLTTLHLAALLGHKEMLSLFAESCRTEFAQGFLYLPGGPHGLTPRQMFILRHVLLPHPPQQPAAVQELQEQQQQVEEEEETSFIPTDAVLGSSHTRASSSVMSTWFWWSLMYSVICFDTAIVLYGSVSSGFLDRNWAIAMVPISLFVICFCRFWHRFSRSRLESMCKFAGIQLSDTLKPLDPSTALTYNAFKATHWYKPSTVTSHSSFFGALMSMTMINAYLKNGALSFNIVIFTMAVIYAVYTLRCNQQERKSSHGMEVVNVIEDTLIYLSFLLPSLISYNQSIDEISPHGLLSLTSSGFQFFSAAFFYSLAQSLLQGALFSMPLGAVFPVRFFHMLLAAGTTFLWQMNSRVAGTGAFPFLMVAQILSNAVHYVCLYEVEVWVMKAFVNYQTHGKKKV